MCTNGMYTERGIKARHGYASERYRIHPEYLVKVDPALGALGVLLEPTTVVAKAWDHIEKIGRRSTWAPQKVLITGAGPIGLLAALLSAQRGYDTYVVDLVTEGRKPEMVRRLGATYFPRGELGEAAAEADVVIECTGFIGMLLDIAPQHVRQRVICLTGVSAAGAESTVDPGVLNRNMVLQNSVLFGSVNANRHHYELAADALAQADPAGSPGSSPARRLSADGPTPTPASPTTSRPSSTSRTEHPSPGPCGSVHDSHDDPAGPDRRSRSPNRANWARPRSSCRPPRSAAVRWPCRRAARQARRTCCPAGRLPPLRRARCLAGTATS